MVLSMRKLLALLLIAFGLLCMLVAPSAADNDNEGVCEGTHIAPPDETTKSITVTAPEGQLISGYCVKAGSIKQGDGPEYIVINPPAESVTITHSSGKDISHYTVTYVPVPDDSTTTTELTTTTTEETTTTTVKVDGSSTTQGDTDTTLSGQSHRRGATPAGITELPRTGSGTTYLTILGVSMVLAGSLLSMRYRKVVS